MRSIRSRARASHRGSFAVVLPRQSLSCDFVKFTPAIFVANSACTRVLRSAAYVGGFFSLPIVRGFISSSRREIIRAAVHEARIESATRAPSRRFWCVTIKLSLSLSLSIPRYHLPTFDPGAVRYIDETATDALRNVS